MRATEYSKMATEAQIQRAITDLLDLCGIPYSVTDAALPIVNGRKGRAKVAKSWQDITACLPTGQMLAIEVKTLHGRFQPGQEAHLERLRQSNAVVVVARSLEDVARLLWEQGVRCQVVRKVLDQSQYQ